MNGMIGYSPSWAIINALEAHRSRSLRGKARLGYFLAKRAKRVRIAIEQKRNIEIGYALTDADRRIVRRKFMTPAEADKRNQITTPYGLTWVRCGYRG